MARLKNGGKRMKKTKIAILTLLLVGLIIGVGFSTWQLDIFQSSSKVQQLKQDDILENYSFAPGKKQYDNDEYTIYLFPSTLYLTHYIQYLNSTKSIKPEEIYGYIEPRIDKMGNPIVDSKGNVIYDKVIQENQKGDDGYLNEVKNNHNYRTTSRPSQYDYCSDWDNKGLYGDPILDQNVNSKFAIEQYNYRNQHEYDRFGYWNSLSKDDGRWLPIKIVVDKNFSNDFYQAVSKRPKSDMGDPRSWFVYSFSNWCYVEHKEDGTYQLPYFTTILNEPELASFIPSDVSQIFTLMENFKEYADSDGIIRLFPKFSNGKGYDAKEYRNGGRDAIKMRVTYNENAATSLKNENDIYLSYLNTPDKITYRSGWTQVSPLKVVFYPNMILENYSSIQFQLGNLSNSVASWQGNWQDFYKVDEKTIQQVVDYYGIGYYNLYVFIGNCEGPYNGIYSGNLNNVYQDVVNAANGADIPYFKGRKLRVLDEMDSNLKATKVLNRPVRLCIEKIRDIRIIQDISKTPDEENIISKYLNEKQSFRLTNYSVYEMESSYNEIENIGSKTPVNQENPYVYLLRNVDFTEVSTSRFQIRFGDTYLEDLPFNDKMDENIDMIFDPTIENNKGTFSKEQRFINAFRSGDAGYFEMETMNVLQENGTYSSQLFFKLKNEDMRGIYDFMIVYKDNKVSLYTYRHTNIFLKILAHDVTKIDEQGFVQHKSETWGEQSNALIFQKEYPIGVKIQYGDLCEVPGERSNKDFEWWSPSLEGWTIEKCINNYVESLLKSQYPNKTKQDVILRDHVTQAQVAYYDKNDQLTFETFKIRKNYIFYIVVL